VSARPLVRDRYSFGNLSEVLEIPDLIAVQRESFRWFLDNGLADIFRDISPITDFSETLSLVLEFDPDDEELRPPPKFSVDECKERDMTYAAPIFVRARFNNAATGEIKEQVVFMGDFPMMTEKGTFVINGTERVVVSQLVRSPGVIFQPGERFRLRNLSKHQLVTGTIHPYRGEWIEFDVEQKPGKDVTAGTKIARKRRLPIFTLLRALGYDELNEPGFLTKFVQHFDFLEGQWEKERLPEGWEAEVEAGERQAPQEAALLEIYRRVRPGEPPSVEAARAYLRNAFFESRRYDLSRVGRYKLNRKLGVEIERCEELFGIELEKPDPDQSVLTRSEVLATCTYLLSLAMGEPGYRLDDQDHFANRRIRSVGELIQNQVRIGLTRMERVVRERMTTQDVEAITPMTLINIRPVVAAIKEFFGTSQLSQFMDQVNPLSGLTHRRRLSALGPGGLSRERAGFEVRDVHFSHYGRMCPIETPEGPNIGLIGALATYGQVNPFGFIESPYRIVKNGKVTDEIIYLAADEEEEYVVAQANAPLNDNNTFRNPRVLVRRSPQAASLQDLRLQLEQDVFFGATTEISFVPPDEVQLMDVSPKQIVSVATALIPFLEHDDANRALMGANMQRQAVPLVRAEAPYIGTGIEARAAHDAADMVLATEAGTVSAVDGDSITVDYRKAGQVRHALLKFERSNQDTCINQKSRVVPGDKVRAGQVLADGPSTDGGELALGKNLLVAFMSWEGYNFEDAVIVSERLVKDDVLTSIHIHEHEIDARDTKLGAEEITYVDLDVTDEVAWAEAVDDILERDERLDILVNNAGVIDYAGIADVTAEAAVAAAVDEVEERVGPIDVLVNNAGVQHRVPLLELDLADWERVLATNLTSAFVVGRAVARHMVPRGAGRIVNIASVQADLARPTIAPYTAAKGGLRNLTRAMCAEWASAGLQVNALAPGYIHTEMTQALVDDPAFDGWVRGLRLLGETPVALLITVFVAMYVLAWRHGRDRGLVDRVVDGALGPICAESLESLGLPLIVAGFVIAAIVRMAQGSATVALTTAAALVQPAVQAATDLNAGQLAAMVLALAAGSVFAGHVNDSGFWLVSRFFGMDTATTLKTWTVGQALIGIVGFVGALAIYGVAAGIA
jgi:DNA-directed RNA polymerase beta subunit